MSSRPDPKTEERVRSALKKATDLVPVPVDFARDVFAELDERRSSMRAYEDAVDRLDEIADTDEDRAHLDDERFPERDEASQ